MDPLKSKNVVAKIIQVYACVNASAWVILAFVIADALNWGIAISAFAIGLFASFLLYAFGEVIDLLQEIKSNTHKPGENETDETANQSELVIYFCKKCGDAYSGEPGYVRYCPECRRTLKETTVTKAEWRSMSDSQKEDNKKKWSTDVFTTI